jgi:hypothetical protein
MSPKNPLYADKVVLKNGGSLVTEDDTSIISVSAAGVASVEANIQDSLASGKIYVGSSSGVSAEVSMSGNATISNTGAVTVTGASGAFTGTGVITGNAGFLSAASSRTPAADNGPNTFINAGYTAVDVGAVTNDANDWITLPSLASVPVGHTITIACNAGTNFELRTPASSSEKINNVIADGAQELLMTDTQTVIVTKVSDTDGWTAYSRALAGGVIATAVTPD